MQVRHRFNFSAGPAVLPAEVLEQIREDIPDWHAGMSVMEVSHRSREFVAVAEQAEQDLRDLLSIPDDYNVLFLQGGATLQFAMAPLNLAATGDKVDYVNTGHWSKKAIAEARRFNDVNVAADAAGSNYCDIPGFDEWRRSADAAYLHYTPNETIGGVEFHFIPDTGDVPLVADMSSTILSRPIDVSRFGVIYAGAQKNIGPAGLTVVIVRKDLVGRARDGVPTLLDYSTYANSGSMSNTPPTFAWYVAGLVFADLKRKGGVAAIGAVNERKARKLYAAIDASPFYSNPVRPDCRSWMNVPFVLDDPALDAKFLGEAEAAGLTNLRGHRAVGGMRASLYNAMPEAGVDALVDFMQEFEGRV
ncbi:MAG TPA: 3-phosphoserine/phosphohydroxythreonine transaminase [Woeseiaceae bacterium]|nr:3-phosphoserine/phosphohydroxythreonine transaminase [Woeseiaceae bacterium]